VKWTHWTTPGWFLERGVRRLGQIALDPCDNAASVTAARMSWDGSAPDRDGLRRSWRESCQGMGERGIVFVNPPYGRPIQSWAEKLADEGRHGDIDIVALLPASTDARWMHENIFATADALAFLKGRLQFGNPPPEGESTSNVLNMAACWGPLRYAFASALQDVAKVWVP
jgi:hypothetical protein